jgi:hypothetical protein
MSEVCPRTTSGYLLPVTSEPGRDPGEEAAYDVARILVAYPALRRIVEIAALAGARAERVVPDPPVPLYLRRRSA